MAGAGLLGDKFEGAGSAVAVAARRWATYALSDIPFALKLVLSLRHSAAQAFADFNRPPRVPWAVWLGTIAAGGVELGAAILVVVPAVGARHCST